MTSSLCRVGRTGLKHAWKEYRDTRGADISYPYAATYKQFFVLTLLELQSRLGDKWSEIDWFVLKTGLLSQEG